MKRLIPIFLIALSACTHTNNWVQELENKNPLKDSTEYISVYFRFDTIINDFEVSGILYPYYSGKSGWSDIENGVRLFFLSRKTGKEYIWTDWDNSCSCFQNIFMSKNVYDIVHSEGFSGFKNGDTYIFNYDTHQSENAQNPFYPNAEYQFYDIDFDGEDELLLNYYHGGPQGGLMSEPYKITDTALVPTTPIGDNSVLVLTKTPLLIRTTKPLQTSYIVVCVNGVLIATNLMKMAIYIYCTMLIAI